MATYPPDYSQFVEVRYGGVSLGTQTVARLAKESELRANELVALETAVSCSIEEIESRKRMHLVRKI